jgi:hypothetical protein
VATIAPVAQRSRPPEAAAPRGAVDAEFSEILPIEPRDRDAMDAQRMDQLRALGYVE